MSSDSESKSLQNEDIEMNEDDSADEHEHTNEFPDLDASDTSSSEDETDNESQEVLNEATQTLEEQVAKKLLDKYSNRLGKQLYIQFPHKLPEDDAELQKKGHALSPLITKVHRPRQRYARFCLLDFNSKEERDSALKSIKVAAKKNAEFKGIIAKIPRTENESFLKELIERKIKSIKNKKAKIQLKRASKQAQGKVYTSSIIITNLPKTATVAEVRKFYPTAVDIQIKPNRDKMKDNVIATITLPSTKEASAAIRKNISLGGTKLIIRFDNSAKTKPHARGKRKKKAKKAISQPISQ